MLVFSLYWVQLFFSIVKASFIKAESSIFPARAHSNASFIENVSYDIRFDYAKTY